MIGRIEALPGEVRVLRPDGEPLKLDRKGFSHF
jgi:hypothetical protein